MKKLIYLFFLVVFLVFNTGIVLALTQNGGKCTTNSDCASGYCDVTHTRGSSSGTCQVSSYNSGSGGTPTDSGSGSISSAAAVISPTIVCSNLNSNGKQCDSIQTGIGLINTNITSFINSIFTIILSISGGIALILIIVSGYQLSLSSGNPEKVKEAQGMLTAAIVGFIFIIFSVAILQIIGVDILGGILPTFKK